MTNMFAGKAGLVAILIASALITIGNLCLSEAYAQVEPGAGGAASKPTSAPAVVGWRGDGTSRYPDATPPTEWYLQENGESKNILWKTKLPCYTWSTPIIVGDKIITRSEPYDLICMDKNTGKLLWIRSHPPFIAVTAEEKKANPAFKKIEPLVADLQKLNDEFVAKGWSKELYKQKYDLKQKINDLTAKADDKYAMPPDTYTESCTGYTGTTPCSDGKFIYITSGDGITACYDMDGNRKWFRYESVAAGWGEHGGGGGACSPTLLGDKFIVRTTNVLALDKKTGAELFAFTGYQGTGNDCYGIVPLKVNGVDYLVAYGNIFRADDGKSVWGGNMIMQFTVHDDVIYFLQFTHMQSFKMAPKGAGGELTVTPLIKEEYNRISFPSGVNPAFKSKINDTYVGSYTASPLYDNGLLYFVGCAGRLVVLDAQKTKQRDAIVYTAFPDFDFKNGFGRKSWGMGLGASPALAGKHIYMTDSTNCTVVMEPGREYKQVAKNTIDYTVPDGWEPKHWTGAHHEQTEASPIFDGSRIYIRGEQFLYCIGEK